MYRALIVLLSVSLPTNHRVRAQGYCSGSDAMPRVGKVSSTGLVSNPAVAGSPVPFSKWNHIFYYDARHCVATINAHSLGTSLSSADSLPQRSKWERPGFVALQSAVIPGLGQVTNGQIWKVPIIYAGGALVFYLVRENNNDYKKYRQAYIYRTDGNPDTKDAYPHFSEFGLLTLREQAHTDRDLSVIVGFIGYAANILDAYVYAHLKDFDVSEDLSMQVQPVNLVNIAGRTTYAVSLKLNFR